MYLPTNSKNVSKSRQKVMSCSLQFLMNGLVIIYRLLPRVRSTGGRGGR